MTAQLTGKEASSGWYSTGLGNGSLLLKSRLGGAPRSTLCSDAKSRDKCRPVPTRLSSALLFLLLRSLSLLPFVPYNRCSRSQRNFSSLRYGIPTIPMVGMTGSPVGPAMGFVLACLSGFINNITEVDGAVTSLAGTQVLGHASCRDFVKVIRLAREILN